MKKPDLGDLEAFVAVARHRSFKRAADELELSPSAISHMMRALERRLDVRLLHRTTRSVSLTEPGERLLMRLEPALRDVGLALEELDPFRGSPSGTVRINAPETAARLLMERVVPEVLARYPDVAVDIVAEGRLVDIVAEGFDAGIRLGESVPQDMIGVRFAGDVRFLAVASPEYLARSGVPGAPEDLRSHSCIRHRMPSGKLYRWEFERHREEISIDVPGRLTLDRIELMVEAAERGLGVAYVPDHAVTAKLAEGRLRPVLEDWCPPIPGLILYYPGRRNVPGSLSAFIDTLREVLP
jgi:DNA-binding transcriptional LysR family regulator